MNKIASVSTISSSTIRQGWGVVLTLLTTMLLGTSATAVAVDREYNIDAQRTDGALLELAEAADVQIVFATQLAQQTNSPMIAGTQSVEQALDKILEGTALQYQFTSDDLVVVTALQPTMAQQSGDVGSSGGGASEDKPVELAPTVTVGSRIEQDLDDVVSSVSVMTAEEIRKQMVSDMSDLFRYEPGIQISGRKGGAQNFIVRGMGADRILMIKDGVRMNEGYGADGLNDIVGRGFIDVDTIKQVEVAKGAVSALFGADALGGVVNFTTKDPVDYLQGDNTYLSVNVENDSRSTEWAAGATGALRLDAWEFSLSAKYRDSDEPKNFVSDLNPAEIDSTSAVFKTVYNLTESKRLKFTLDYYNQDRFRPDDGTDKGNFAGLISDDWRINSEVRDEEKDTTIYSVKYNDEDASWGGFLLDTFDLSIDFNDTEQRNRNVVNHSVPNREPGATRDNIDNDSYAQEIFSVTSTLSKEFQSESLSHEITYGIDYSNTLSERPQNDFRVYSDGEINRDEDSTTFPENDTVRVGAYAQDRIELMDGRLAIIPGARYAYYKVEPKFDDVFQSLLPDPTVVPEEISESKVSAQLGASFDITENLKLTAQWAQGFKVPSFDLAFFFFSHTPSFGANVVRTIPNPDVVPEESDSYELGLKGTTGDLRFDVSVFQSDFDNFLTIVFLETITEDLPPGGFFTTQDVDITQYQNIDSVRIKGTEVKLDYSVTDHISVFLNGSYIDGEDRTSGDYIRNIVPLSGNLGVEYAGLNGFGRVAVRMADDMRKFNDGDLTTPGYAVLDVMGGLYITDALRFNFSVLNILNKEYIEYSSVSGVPDDGRDVSRRSQPGRSVSARLSYEF